MKMMLTQYHNNHKVNQEPWVRRCPKLIRQNRRSKTRLARAHTISNQTLNPAKCRDSKMLTCSKWINKNFRAPHRFSRTTRWVSWMRMGRIPRSRVCLNLQMARVTLTIPSSQKKCSPSLAEFRPPRQMTYKSRMLPMLTRLISTKDNSNWCKREPTVNLSRHHCSLKVTLTKRILYPIQSR